MVNKKLQKLMQTEPKTDPCPTSNVGICEVEFKAGMKWLKLHRRKCKLKHGLDYFWQLTPTGIGSAVEIVCYECDASNNVTHSDHW